MPTPYIYESDWDQDRAFRDIYTTYRDRILRLVKGFTRDEDDAEDILQQVFLRVHVALPGFKGRSQLFTWIYRIAINCCKDWVKQAHVARYDRKDEAWWDALAGSQTLHGKADRTDAAIEARETRDALDRALQSLKPDFRAAIVLREIDGLSYREIGARLACSEGTVKSRISRARAALRRELTARSGVRLAVEEAGG